VDTIAPSQMQLAQRARGSSRSGAGIGDRRFLVIGCIAVLMVLLATGCASFTPMPERGAGFMQRTQTHTRGGVTVAVAVPSADEAAAVFGIPLERREIQPV
jgi:hypothetical protein